MVKLHLFWGGPLSNWYKSKFVLEGKTYNTSEQYMMEAKALFFGDEEMAKKIMASNDPREQKAYGRKVKDFDPAKWDEVARDLVYKGCLAKFSQDEKLKEFILSTDDETLVEASPYDRIWGIGLSAEDPRAQDPAQWQGKNWLGEVLMRVRETLKK